MPTKYLTVLVITIVMNVTIIQIVMTTKANVRCKEGSLISPSIQWVDFSFLTKFSITGISAHKNIELIFFKQGFIF
jgi:hypothetical protein